APERIRAARRWAADRHRYWLTRGACCRSARGGSPERFHLHTEAPRPPNSLGKAFPRVSKYFSSLGALLPPPAANGHAQSLPLERRATPLPFSPFLGFRAHSANAGLRLRARETSCSLLRLPQRFRRRRPANPSGSPVLARCGARVGRRCGRWKVRFPRAN